MADFPYAKGHVTAPNLQHLKDLANQRNGHIVRALPPAPEPSWDSRKLNIVGPIKNQKSCGSCWDFSGTGVVEVAFYKAGLLKPDGSQSLSEQYTLSCGKNGGCNGDDNTTVLDWAKKTGLPLDSAYGSYTASRGRCSYKQGMQLYKITDWGFADSQQGQGVAPTQDIKEAIKAYGCVGAGVAAGGDEFWNTGKGVGSGRSSNIDHDVIIIGWDDSKGSNGAWLMRNSWGSDWGSDDGCGWVEYGAYSLGSEAVWAVVNNPNPGPTPGPVTPVIPLTLAEVEALAAGGIDNVVAWFGSLTSDNAKAAVIMALSNGWPKNYVQSDDDSNCEG